MCEQQEGAESLFSLEIFIHSVRVDKQCDLSDELALGVRLLDFPTLLVRQGVGGAGGGPERPFHRGKACVFRTSLASLCTQLRSAPLHAMVLDVKGDPPRLIGTALVSLADVVDGMRAGPSPSGGERGRFGVRSLDGEEVGSVSLSYRLRLGPPVADPRGGVGVPGRPRRCVGEESESTERPERGGDRPHSPSGEEDAEDVARVPAPAEGSGRRRHREESDASGEEDLAMFCPPSLFFCNTREEAEEKRREAGGLLDLGSSGSFTLDDADEEEETADGGEPIDRAAPAKRDGIPSRNKQTQTNGAAPTALGEALRQMPLLNALLLELSQLNAQTPQPPAPVHPGLAWIYGPASTEPPAGTTPPRVRTGSGPQAAPLPKHFQTPRTCSAPAREGDRNMASAENRRSGTTPKKKLAYGKNRAFHLRLKKVAHLGEKRRECAEFTVRKEQPRAERRTIKPERRKPEPEQEEGLDGPVETAVRRFVPQETVTPKPRKTWEKHDTSGISEKSASESTVVNVGCEKNAANKQRSNARRSPPESGGHGEIRSSASSRLSRPGSAFSESGVEEEEESDYSDDFNSLHPSDAPSPDLRSSPESSRAKTPGSPLRPDLWRSDSGSERFGTRPALPVPIRSTGSPRRSLSSTYVIRPRTTTSALSFSSDDAEADRSLSSRAEAGSGKQRAGTSSDSDSCTSRRGRNNNNSNVPVREVSAESQSSLEPEDVEELGDDLGTLDFRKEYQNISDLLASNLPGYTI